MDLKKLVSQFAYRIEQKPDGGFIARASDPSIPPLEAPTREELLKLVQQKVLAGITTEFPDLKLALDGTQHQFAFHVERTPAGGFSIHSADPNAEVVHAATEHDLQTQVLEKILNAAGKRFLPQIAQAIAAQGNAAHLKVVVNKTSFKNAAPEEITLASPTSLPAQDVTPTTRFLPAQDVTPTTRFDGASFTNADINKTILGGAPITPESSNFGKFLRLLPVILLLGILIYFLLHRA